jgi:hypothetical protein
MLAAARKAVSYSLNRTRCDLAEDELLRLGRDDFDREPLVA